MSAEFRFKQFIVRHDKCAMKVGTDGVLLGAWAAAHHQPEKILDVGTGTGLIALMLAQRFPAARIDALEINEEAAGQALENKSQSPFNNQIEVFQQDVFSWNPPGKYDLVVCNPPFYANAHPTHSAARATARHGIKFNLEEFLKIARDLLTPTGKLAMILPTHIFEALPDSALHLCRICKVFPVPGKRHHRILAEWKLAPCDLSEEEIIIENGPRHDYHESYISLTRQFYLKF